VNYVVWHITSGFFNCHSFIWAFCFCWQTLFSYCFLHFHHWHCLTVGCLTVWATTVELTVWGKGIPRKGGCFLVSWILLWYSSQYLFSFQDSWLFTMTVWGKGILRERVLCEIHSGFLNSWENGVILYFKFWTFSSVIHLNFCCLIDYLTFLQKMTVWEQGQLKWV